VTALLLQNS